jgi:hypothetical protein
MPFEMRRKWQKCASFQGHSKAPETPPESDSDDDAGVFGELGG